MRDDFNQPWQINLVMVFYWCVQRFNFICSGTVTYALVKIGVNYGGSGINYV